MTEVLVAVGDHRAAPVPAPPPDDVHGRGIERVRRAHDRADVEVVAPVLDADVQLVPPLVEVGDYSYYDDSRGPEHFLARCVRYHFDFIGDRLIIECDSTGFHNDAHQRREDARRDRKSTVGGYHVLRIDYADVMFGWDSVFADITDMVRSRRHLGAVRI